MPEFGSPGKTALFDFLTRKIGKAKAGACLLYCSTSDLSERRLFYLRAPLFKRKAPRHAFKLHLVGNDFFFNNFQDGTYEIHFSHMHVEIMSVVKLFGVNGVTPKM